MPAIPGGPVIPSRGIARAGAGDDAPEDVRAPLPTDSAAGVFWTFVGIRVAVWAGIALAFLAYPYRLPPATPQYEVFEWRTELLFNVFARWDAVWFLSIASDGYTIEKEAAFFPLYPLLVYALGGVVRSPLVAGVLVSLAAGGVAAVVLAKIARPLLGERGARDAVLYLALFPLSFFFTAVYSDGLFVALATGAFLAALRNRPWLAGVLGGLAVGTRMIGLALLPALAIVLWSHRRSLRAFVPLAVLPLALGLYALVLRWQLGDARAMFRAQGDFWDRHLATLGPLGGLWEATAAAVTGIVDAVHTGDPGATLNVLYFLLLLAAFALTWIAWRSLGPAFGVYSLAYLAVPLTVPGSLPLVSFPRFLLGDFPLFLALAAVLANRPRERQIVLCAFAAVGALAAFGFARNAFIA
ncbi:MAG: glycosyltransferase family 39 protein [Thermoleophilia bacterium]|nr:glycosyltransferase family 39 protein [Thermoleophilia bacterium]